MTTRRPPEGIRARPCPPGPTFALAALMLWSVPACSSTDDLPGSTPSPDDDTPAQATSTPMSTRPPASPGPESPGPESPGPESPDPASPAPSSPTPFSSPTPGPTASPPPTLSYHATVRQTEHGIIHVLADDLGSVAYGEGYAMAQNHLCELADQILKVRSQRALHFGPGEDNANLDSDFGYLTLNTYQNARDGFPTQSPQVKALLEGYSAGYNRYIRDTPPADWPEGCTAGSWVQPISPIDLLAYYLNLAMVASSNALLPGVSRAQPPAPDSNLEPAPLPAVRHDIGSNGWTLGGERTASGRGMMLANPHFPWEGELKFFEVQLTVPGVLNVYGGALLGSPVVNIGFNEHVAWTHTFSWASRGTFYRLKLDPRNPTRYRYDNGYRDMIANTFTIQVKQKDGHLEPFSRTLYRTHYGPMIALEDLGWTQSSALCFRDANANTQMLIEQWLGMNLASDLDELRQVHAEVHGIPWAYTMASDDTGGTWFADSSAVPHLSEAAIEAWQTALETDPLVQVAWSLGVPMLDGTDPANEWLEVPGNQVPGLVPLDEAPQLERSDFVVNSNDSHWLANPAAPLEGFSPLYGPERTPRHPRTRMNLTLLTEGGDEGASGADQRFTLEELQEVVMCNRGLMGEMLRNAVVERCAATPVVTYEGALVDLRAACQAITAWDGLANLDSHGEVIWREFLGSYDDANLEDAGALFAVPFDPEDPIFTPNTLAVAPPVGADPILQALAGAIVRLQTAGIKVDAATGDVQHTWRGDVRIPIPGLQEQEGGFQMVYHSTSINSTLLPTMPYGEEINETTYLTRDGYLINYGSSFLMAMEFADGGPRARALLAYSQSSDPASPYFADQTWMFSQKAWRDVKFTEGEIEADPGFSALELEEAMAPEQ